jgi:cell division topological specificity factor
MGLLNYFKKQKKNSALEAKERLQILIAHERNGCRPRTPDYLPNLKSELMSVIRKYIEVSEADVNVQYEEGNHCDVLELNIILPEKQNL